MFISDKEEKITRRILSDIADECRPDIGKFSEPEIIVQLSLRHT
ncbi:hypothetical protein [Emticicia fluvialis]|nr:hypothetical protein [Emticicia fluvialis]